MALILVEMWWKSQRLTNLCNLNVMLFFVSFLKGRMQAKPVRPKASVWGKK